MPWMPSKTHPLPPLVMLSFDRSDLIEKAWNPTLCLVNSWARNCLEVCLSDSLTISDNECWSCTCQIMSHVHVLDHCCLMSSRTPLCTRTGSMSTPSKNIWVWVWDPKTSQSQGQKKQDQTAWCDTNLSIKCDATPKTNIWYAKVLIVIVSLQHAQDQPHDAGTKNWSRAGIARKTAEALVIPLSPQEVGNIESLRSHQHLAKFLCIAGSWLVWRSKSTLLYHKSWWVHFFNFQEVQPWETRTVTNVISYSLTLFGNKHPDTLCNKQSFWNCNVWQLQTEQTRGFYSAMPS